MKRPHATAAVIDWYMTTGCEHAGPPVSETCQRLRGGTRSEYVTVQIVGLFLNEENLTFKIC